MVKSNLDYVHKAELELALKFSDLCLENKLNYFMLGGTQLGAIRHNGFIPWDDDMDFGMLREDYEQVLNILLEKRSDIEVAHYSNGKTLDYPMKIENSKLMLVDKANMKEIEKPIWIDIFPIDGMPNNSIKRKMHEYHLLFIRLMFKYSKFDENVAVNANIKRGFAERSLISLGKIIKPERFLSRDNWVKRLDKSLKKYSPRDSKYSVNFMGAYKFREMFPSNIYSEIKQYSFENTEFMGIADSDYYLSQMYGNYMQEPDDDFKNKHNTQIREQ